MIFPKNFIVIDDEPSVSKENNMNIFNQKVESFISIDLLLLKRNYNYFNFDFTKCIYIFITSELLLTLFLYYIQKF